MEFHVYHHHIDGSCSKPDDKILDTLKGMETALLNEFQRIAKIMSQMDDDLAALKVTVTGLVTVDTSVKALLTGIPALISAAVAQSLAAGATPEQLQAVTDATAAISGEIDGLTAAVTAGTPAAPTP